jgi:hypothetical protein
MSDMRITEDVEKALKVLGYSIEHVPSDDDPEYSVATKGNERLVLQRYIEFKPTKTGLGF